MKLLYDNKILSATLDCSSENPDYPIENLQDTVLAKVYRSMTDDINITIDQITTASYFAIMNHNLSESALITLQGNNSDSWVSPSFETTLTWKEGIIISHFAETTYNYWRLEIIDDDTGADGYIQIGGLFIGTYLQMPGMKKNQSIKDMTTSKSKISYSGQSYGNEGYEYRSFKVNFPQLSDTQRTGIRVMWTNNKNIHPLICLIWANRQDLETPIYCVIDQTSIEIKRTESDNLPWETSLKFREVF